MSDSNKAAVELLEEWRAANCLAQMSLKVVKRLKTEAFEALALEEAEMLEAMPEKEDGRKCVLKET